MNCTQALKKLQDGTLDACLSALYGAALPAARPRYQNAVRAFADLYGAEREILLLSVPGRSELSGNHTDHNRGLAIAAAISADIIAVVSKNTGTCVRLKSEGFAGDEVDLSAYTAPIPEKFASSEALIAGVAQGFLRAGFAAGGFDAYTTSDVPKGSGLSSSAAFEIMVAHIQNVLYNERRVDSVQLAKIAKYAENEFFGKPCGLLDQLATVTGGIIAIDFADAEDPVIEKLDFDMNAAGFELCIVNTGGNHADLTPDYAAVPAEMHAVAKELGATVLREASEEALIARLAELREKLGDRALLRALHFFEENKRVLCQKTALREGDLDAFFAHVIASGRSSFQYLQNVYSPAHPQQQGLSLALFVAEQFVKTHGGAFRVHGGGFAGTIQAFVPTNAVEDFRKVMDSAFGEGRCMVLRIRPVGAVKI